MTWGEWLSSLNWLGIIAAAAAVVAAAASVYGVLLLRRDQQRTELRLSLAEEQLLTNLVENEGPMMPALQPDDHTFYVHGIDQEYVLVQSAQPQKAISLSALAVLVSTGLVNERGRGAHYVTPRGRAYVSRLKRRQRWRFWPTLSG